MSQGKLYKAVGLEMLADNGSIVVHNTKDGKKIRVSVPEWKHKMEVLAISWLKKRHSDNGFERDTGNEANQLVQCMQCVLKEAESQGDVTNPNVLKHLCNELNINKKYTMKPKMVLK